MDFHGCLHVRGCVKRTTKICGKEWLNYCSSLMGNKNGHGKRENNGITVHSTMPPLCLGSASYQFTSLNRWECSCYTEQKCSLIIDIFNPLSHFSWPLVPFDCQHHLFDWLQTAHRIIIHPILQSYVYWIPSCLSSTQLSDIVLLWFLI